MFLEPIGGAKPKFSMDTISLHLVRTVGESLSLACPAQGYPLPAFRLVAKIFILGNFRAYRGSKAKVLFDWYKHTFEF